MKIQYWSYETVKIGPLIIETWSFFAIVGLLGGFLLFLYLSNRLKMPRLEIFYLGIFGLTGGLIGAKIGGVIFNFDIFYNYSWLDRLNLLKGPSFSFAGILGLLIAGTVYILYLNKYTNKKINFWGIADITTLSTALFLIIFRMGCFLLNDHIGIKTQLPFGIIWPNGITRHPISLYFILNNLAILLFFGVLYKKYSLKPGKIFLFGVSWYLLSRFLIAFLQEEEKFFGLSTLQYISLVFLIIIVFLLIIYSKKRKSTFLNLPDNNDDFNNQINPRAKKALLGIYQKRGFTLIELLVVISIIAVLSSMVLTIVRPLVLKARDVRRMAELKSLKSAIEAYYDEYGTYPHSSLAPGLWMTIGASSVFHGYSFLNGNDWLSRTFRGENIGGSNINNTVFTKRVPKDPIHSGKGYGFDYFYFYYNYYSTSPDFAKKYGIFSALEASYENSAINCVLTNICLIEGGPPLCSNIYADNRIFAGYTDATIGCGGAGSSCQPSFSVGGK